MKRLESLEARRQVLLARCDAQRAEFGQHLARLQSGRQLMQWTARAPRAAANSPVAWLAAAAGLLFLLRPSRLVGRLAWLTGALSLVARAGRLIRLIGQLRELRAGMR